MPILSQKSSSWTLLWIVKYILQESNNFNFNYGTFTIILTMEPDSSLIFKNISSLANLNSWTKFESTKQKILHNKLLEKQVREKLYLT